MMHSAKICMAIKGPAPFQICEVETVFGATPLK